jgi:Phosphodiester glycosidase
MDSMPNRGKHRAGRGRKHPRLRRVGLAILILMIVPAWSFAHAMTAPGNAPLSARAVEWLSNHGGRPLVVWAETIWLNHHKPPVGGDPSGGIPTEAAASPSGGSADPLKMVPDHLAAPADVRPIVAHPLANEGDWQAIGRRIGGIPTMYASFFRPDTVHTSLVAGVVWMDQRLVRARLVPGVQDPGGSGWSWLGEVPEPARPSLVAAFNSGFYLRESHGGFFADGKTVGTLQNGSASLVISKDGTANVGAWGRDVSMGANVASVRQNLRLIVDNGRPVSGLTADTSNTWGATYGNTVLAWRSAVGVTKQGALLYGAGDGLSAVSLASVMARAGAVRAMEMDINHVWVTFETYRVDTRSIYGAVSDALLPGMWDHPERYLKLDERDFVAMFARPLSTLTMVPAQPSGSP